MSSEPLIYSLPKRRIRPPVILSAIKEALRRHPGATVNAEVGEEEFAEEPQMGLAYTLTFPAEAVFAGGGAPKAGRRPLSFTIEVYPGDGEGWAYLELDTDAIDLSTGGDAIVAHVLEVVGSIAQLLGGQARPDEPGELPMDPVLPDWQRVRAYLHEELEIDSEGEDWVTVTCELEGGRTQQVDLSLSSDADDRQWLLLESSVCQLEHLDPKEALERNVSLAFATLALYEGRYDLVYNFPMGSLTAAVLEQLLWQIAEEADDLEEELTGEDVY